MGKEADRSKVLHGERKTAHLLLGSVCDSWHIFCGYCRGDIIDTIKEKETIEEAAKRLGEPWRNSRYVLAFRKYCRGEFPEHVLYSNHYEML
jgi:hypothetical protein